jgi:phage N-6-adenine-methyltransferase
VKYRCPICRCSFRPTRSDAKTCSSRCRQKAHRRRLAVTRKTTRPVTDNAHWFSSLTDEWETPQYLFDELDREFHFTLDVCATAENAKCAAFYSRTQDGLAQPWEGVCWMNPPYGRTISLWIAKAYNSAQAGATIVALVPSRTDTAWWQDYVAKIPGIRYLRGRLRFGSAKSNAPFPNAVVVFKPNGNVSY